MAQHNTETTLNAYYKEVYADGVNHLIPENIRVLKKVKFSEADQLGEKYVQPVMLAHEHGFSVGTGAYALNDAIASESAEAQVDSKQMLLRTSIGYDAADRMAGSTKSFVKWGDQLFKNMLNSMSKRLEILQIYGGTSIGVVSAASGGVITVSTATWAPGIWSGSKGMIIEAFTALTAGSQHNGDLTVSAVDLDARTVTVTGTSAAVAPGDFLFFKGYRGAEQNGIDKIVTNSGDLYNISAATYELWKGSSYSCGTARLTVSKVLAAASRAAERGCEEELLCLVNPRTWADLNTDLAALRLYDSSYSSKKAEVGTEEISLHAQNGKLTIVSSIYCKEGEAFMVPVSRCKRIGSTDITFNRPGQSEKVFLELPSNAGFELRCRSAQNFFCERPAYMVKLTGIVNGQ